MKQGRDGRPLTDETESRGAPPASAKQRGSGANQAVAEQNLTAILDAAEGLMRRGEPVGFSAVAERAGVSRPTVYAHFPDRNRLLQAVAERALGQAAAAIASAHPDDGPPDQALRRVILASWDHLARHQDIAHATAAELPHQVLHAAHQQVVAVLERLIDRGRRERVFRRDLDPGWLVTASLALIHAAAAGVRRGELDEKRAVRALAASVEDVCVGRPK
jgi:AcrR family transcriptional regulator